LPPLKFWWYDGDSGDKSLKPLRPNEDITRGIVKLRGSLPGSGCLIVADKGNMPSAAGSRLSATSTLPLT